MAIWLHNLVSHSALERSHLLKHCGHSFNSKRCFVCLGVSILSALHGTCFPSIFLCAKSMLHTKRCALALTGGAENGFHFVLLENMHSTSCSAHLFCVCTCQPFTTYPKPCNRRKCFLCPAEVNCLCLFVSIRLSKHHKLSVKRKALVR